ncbi:hypothetical protein V6N11_021557 [Hibiscus sabdariffa]|uniref:Secreted protein n=2 Tax=Hibiscus sabdariffa TaxID=183260 RepID=A0ABR2C3I3_9ROSI
MPTQRLWKWWHQLVVIDLLVKRIGLVDFRLVERRCNALALTRDELRGPHSLKHGGSFESLFNLDILDSHLSGFGVHTLCNR